MKDIRRLRLARFFRVPRRFFAIDFRTVTYWGRYPSAARIPRNGGGAKVILENGGEI